MTFSETLNQYLRELNATRADPAQGLDRDAVQVLREMIDRGEVPPPKTEQ